MKKIVCVMLGMVCLTCGAYGENRIGAYVSAMSLIGDGEGELFGGGVRYEWLFSQNVGVDLRASYLDFSDGDTGVIPLMLGPIVVIPVNSITLTFGAGGMYTMLTDGDAEDALGFYANAGARGPISDGLEWFAEIQYSDVTFDGETTTERRDYSWGYTISTIEYADAEIQAIGANAGVLWHF